MKRPWNIAHRGAPQIATENTLSSFEAAIRLGVSAIELDIHLTKDHRLVVHHDDELGRTVEGRGRIGVYTLKELKRFRIRGAQASERVPSLEEVLDLCRGKCHLAVEGKTDVDGAAQMAKVLARTLRQKSKPQDATLISFCQSFIGHIRERLPEFPAGPSFEKEFPPSVGLYFNPSVVVMSHEIVNKKSAAPFQKRGVPIWVYTVDDRKEWNRLAKIGVAGIISNRPDLFLSGKTRRDFP